MTTATSQAASSTRAISVREYLDTLVGIIRSPSAFYKSVQLEQETRKALTFLLISSVFHATVSMSYFYENSLLMGGIYLLNDIFMPVLAAVFSFLLAGMLQSSSTAFLRILSIYAYASGAIMVISWIPSLGMILEPIRAVLVIIGLKKACDIGWIKAIFIVACSGLLLLVFFWSIAPVLSTMKTMFFT